MRLLRIELEFFRNLVGQTIDLHPRYNLLVGDNGQGKTNFLEAVGCLGTLRSFRGAGRGEMIRHGEKMCRVAGRVLTGKVEHDLSFSLTTGGRAQFLDGRQVRAPEEYLSHLRMVSFIPEDVGIITGSPSWRRRVIDRSVFEINPGYVTEYRRYLAVLRQRNSLLRARRHTATEVDSWSQGLAEAGAVLVRRRLELLGTIEPVMAETCASLGFDGKLGLSYKPSFRMDEEELCRPADATRISHALATRLHEVSARESRAGHTVVGPHRDNVAFTLDGRDMGRFSSQGQKRGAMLSFRLALARAISNASGSNPLVLLDDVASELDATRHRALGRLAAESEAQFFITTTSEEGGLMGRESGYVFEVREGRVGRLK